MLNSGTTISFKLVIAPVSLLLLSAVSLCLSSCLYREYPIIQDYEETEYRTEYLPEHQSENITVAHTGKVEYRLMPYYYWSCMDLNFKGCDNVWYYGYELPEYNDPSISRLKFLFQPQLQFENMYLSVFDVTGTGHIDYPDPISSTGTSEKGLVDWTFFTGSATSTWLDRANSQLGQARFVGGRSNLWTDPGMSKLIELDAGYARTIAVIISGPVHRWNCDFSLSVMPVYYTTETRLLADQTKSVRHVPSQVKKQKVVYEFRQIPFWEIIFSR